MYAGIGAGVAVLVLGVAIFFYMRNKNSKKGDSTTKPTKADNGPGPMPSMQLVQQQPQYSPPQPQQPQPEQYLYTRPQQFLYKQQPAIPPPPPQTIDRAMQQQQQQLYMHQYTQPTQVSTSGYYQASDLATTNPQGQQAMTFYQPLTITSEKDTMSKVASAVGPAVTTYIPPMPMPMPALSTSYATVSPTATATILGAPAMPSPTLVDDGSSIRNPAVPTAQGPQALLVSKVPQFVGGDGLSTANAPAPAPLNSPQYFENT